MCASSSKRQTQPCQWPHLYHRLQCWHYHTYTHIHTHIHRHTEVHNYQLQRNNTDTTGSAGCLECLSSHGVSLHYNNVGDCSYCLSICPWQVILWLMCLQKSAVEIITACLAPCFLLAQPSVYLSCHLGKAGLQEIVCVFVWVRVSLMKCWNNNSTGGGRRCYRGIQCPSVKKVEFWSCGSKWKMLPN